jgi:hypothetical protein
MLSTGAKVDGATLKRSDPKIGTTWPALSATTRWNSVNGTDTSDAGAFFFWL